MAVAKNKIRIKVTLERELAEALKAEADSLGTTRSEMIADIVTNHYKETTQNKNLKDK